MTFFKRSSFCVVTGASRGLGREIALQLAQGWSREGVPSDIVLVARTETDLKTTKIDVERSCPGATAHVIPADLGDLSTLQELFSRCVAPADSGEHAQFVLVNNAGTMCDITRPMSEQTDPSAIQADIAVNFTSMSVLTSLFLSRFTEGERVVVNVTSLLAKLYMAGCAMYSATRAARNALMGVLAAENPSVRFLTYSPGPCMTDMFQSVPEHCHSQSVRDMFQGLIDRGEYLTCHQSIARLMDLLGDSTFENAAVIDYYDFAGVNYLQSSP